ncbi:VCBS repeat-containing protein [Tenacibaculum agarivorans]|uniref:VCBS repeat-containing protein n=1 Tax=Tenacibaculum agarivorans TaxID=1908389 RepID=UPI00094B8E16|nr:VCBS repeat-containing protein [Tenacibaculum agarivorans]
MKTRLITLLFVLSLTLFNCDKTNKQSPPIKNKKYLFEKVSTEITGINFKNEIEDNEKHNIISYIYYYNGGGVAIGDFNNDQLDDIYFVSNKQQNKLYLNKGNLKFEDITAQAGVQGKASWQTGATVVDINNDGFLDIYVCAVSGLLDFTGHNELYINNGDNTFTERSKEYNLNYKGFSTQAYFFDYDKDDDLDVYIVNHAVHTKTSHGPALLRKKRTDLTGDVLLENKKGNYINSSEKAKIYGGVNGYGLSASIADFNNDGWDDIYVCNDFHEDDYYYLNNQDGTFTESLAKNFSTISRFSMGSDASDINNDGYQDLITLDMLPKDERVIKESEGDDTMLNFQIQLQNLGYQDQYSRNMLQVNNSGAYFHEEALFNDVASTDWSWSPLFADFNNDGHQDLFITNGILRRPNNLDFRMYISSNYKYRDKNKSKEQWLLSSLKEMPNGKVPNQIFKGNSNKFENKNNEWIDNTPSLSNGAAYSDLDLDGDLDLVINNINEHAVIYKNTSSSNKNHITLNLKYQKNNSNGIGSKAILHSKNKKQTKQLFNSRGFLSATSNNLHFGLDTIKKIDSIQIIWPNNLTQKIINPEINKTHTVTFNKNEAVQYDHKKHSAKNLFISSNEVIDFTHREDSYNDFYNERLIPFKVSTTGPAISIGDIDKNGYDDIFIGNGSGNKAKLFLNDGSQLTPKNIPEIETDKEYEDICSSFFDADNDGDLDLYVGSGIHQKRNVKYETDRLYIYENGNFIKSNTTPLNPNIVSCVKPCDYDKDGDIDLFIGNRSNPNDYGQKVSSYILNNDGQGNFTIDENFKLKSHVTDGLWIDINNDQQPDLIISTEWDTPKIYINLDGKLSLQQTNNSLKGLWQTVSSFDIDDDGDLDLLFGNWGKNSKFQASEKAPLHMYHLDFDDNGKAETILAYNLNGEYYPIYSKDELASQMNIIKKRFVKYKDYALKTIDEILTPEKVNKSNKYIVNHLSSGYLRNDNGVFTEFIDFPKPFQLAPIHSFLTIKNPIVEGVLAFGNSKSVNTYHGAYESLKGLLLMKNNQYKSTNDLGISPISQEIRNAQILKLRNKSILLLIPNNNAINSYIINEK